MSEKVISFHYNLKDKDGNLIDSSEGQSPLAFLVGSGHIIPGLEKELIAMNVGDKKEVEVGSADAYGEIRPDLIVTVEKTQFGDQELEIGMQFQINEEPNAPIFAVQTIEDDKITLNGNHPLAGIDLVFNVELTETRDATEEEVTHGHAHGAGGHQH